MENSAEIPETPNEISVFPKEFENPLEDRTLVRIVVPKEQLLNIAKTGLQAENNRKEGLVAGIEEIFRQTAEEVAKENKAINLPEENKPYDRTQCIIAYPVLPGIRHPRSFNPDTHTILEALVDGKKALVSNGEYFTDASRALKEEGDEESARDRAGDYWEVAQTLSDFMTSNDPDKYFYPEVLIPDEIPIGRLRVSESQKLPNPVE